MNSRIIELYDEAQYKAGSKKTWSTTNLDVAEELVRLVVEECIRIVTPSTDQRRNPHHYMGGVEAVELLDEIAHDLRKHFGVES